MITDLASLFTQLCITLGAAVYIVKAYLHTTRVRHFLQSSRSRTWLGLSQKSYSSGSDHFFSKLHGLGNDFIIVDNTRTGSMEPIYNPEQAVKLCNRNYGIGADGLIFVMPGSNGCDYTMRMYNADGSEPQMCGNGIRCMAKFIQQDIECRPLPAPTTATTTTAAEEIPGRYEKEIGIVYRFWTNAGVIVPVIAHDGLITVDMGAPILSPPSDVPTLLVPTKDGAAVDSPILLGSRTYLATAVSMGNPHSVIFVDDVEAMAPPFHVVGPLAESSPAFPEKVNAEFAQVLSPTHLRMKVWERGAGPTLACGTGACAVVVAAVLTGRAGRACRVTLPGGDLHIRWDARDNKCYMTGPAELVCRGTIDAQSFCRLSESTDAI